MTNPNPLAINELLASEIFLYVQNDSFESVDNTMLDLTDLFDNEIDFSNAVIDYIKKYKAAEDYPISFLLPLKDYKIAAKLYFMDLTAA